jgi:hypothetical protein
MQPGTFTGGIHKIEKLPVPGFFYHTYLSPESKARSLHMAGLLALLLFPWPSRSNSEQWQMEMISGKNARFTTVQDHSYGDSSGFAPDSLLIHRLVKPNAAQTYSKGGKYPKRKIDSILPRIQNR